MVRVLKILICWLLVLIGFVPFAAVGFDSPRRSRLPNLDQRRQQAPPNHAFPVSNIKANAVARLREKSPSVRVAFDEIFGLPRSIQANAGFLTGVDGLGGAVSAAASGELGGEQHRGIKAFLKEHRNLFGHGPELLAQAKVKKDFVTTHSGMRTTIWEQQMDDLPVFGATLTTHTTSKGELIQVNSRMLPDPEQAANAGMPNRRARVATPPLTARDAVALAADNLGEKLGPADINALDAEAQGPEKRQRFKAVPLNGETTARLVWLPMNAALMRLCWQIILTSRARGETFQVLVDAQNGEVLLRHCLTVYAADATYRVFTSDSPSPFSPGHQVPSTNQPPSVPRSLLTLPALNTNASPQGWIADGENETRGNNADAHLDRNADDTPDLPRPQGAPFRVFDFPIDLGASPATYGAAAVVQGFYWCNWMHDKLYELGFTEAAGNFQADNLGRGGAGGDAVQFDGQDGSGENNANISVPPDGEPPRIQMFLWTFPTPARDGDFDTEILLHEYTHGLSVRLVGGGEGIAEVQSEGMGEGWSDFYALTLLSESSDDLDGAYAAGAYATYHLFGLQENYYFGIRRYPYSTDLSKNPLTFADIDPLRASSHEGVPLSPLFSDGVDPSEVHAQGEVWCATLWQVRANLIRKHGFAAGNQLVLQLVTDGMKLSPVDPTFVEARDAILLADRMLTGGANQPELWEAFARRGLGIFASAPPSYTTSGVEESFDVPGDLAVRPGSGFTAHGQVGGPFSVATVTYTFTNLSGTNVSWQAFKTADWLTVSQTGGVLAPEGFAQVTVTLSSGAYLFPEGVHAARVVFTNLTSGKSQSREFTLRIGQRDYLTQLFDPRRGDVIDMNGTSLTFTPDGSSNFYAVCRQTVTQLPTDPEGGHVISVLPTVFTEVNLPEEKAVRLFGQSYSTFFVGPGIINFLDDLPFGFPTFPMFDGYFAQPRICALYIALGLPGEGSWKMLPDRVAVTWHDFDTLHGLNNVQVEMFLDGRVRMTFLVVEGERIFSLVGLSPGHGVPEDFFESDMTAYPSCLKLFLPQTAREGDGTLTNRGRIQLPGLTLSDLTVPLISQDPASVSVPAQVLIPAGRDEAAFDVTIGDDAVLDGTQPVLVTARAGTLGESGAVVLVHDNETAILDLVLPGSAGEGDGEIAATLYVSAAPARDVLVAINSVNTNALQAPPSIVLPAGQTSVVFMVSVVDDALLDGPEAGGLVAHVENWLDGTSTLTVLDNESLDLALTVPFEICEGALTLGDAGVLTLSGPVITNLTVTLNSSDTNRVRVPGVVTVLAGQSSVCFDLALLDNSQVESDSIVNILAQAAGWSDTTASILVHDDDTPHAPSNPSPPDAATDVSARVRLAWHSDALLGEKILNGGFETGELDGWLGVPLPDGESGAPFFINYGQFNPYGPDRPIPPYEGTFNAVADGTTEMYQIVSIPACEGQVFLRWVDRISNHADDFGEFQQFRIEVRPAYSDLMPGDPPIVIYSTRPGDPLFSDWTQRSVDLSRFRGQTITIAFVVIVWVDYLTVHLDNISVSETNSPTTTYDIYLGTNAALTAAQWIGSTSNAFFDAPLLAPATAYYWQVIARRAGTNAGPVWQFTTRGVHHFAWASIPSPQTPGVAFPVTVAARDEFDRTVTAFTEAVSLEARVETSPETNSILGPLERTLGDYRDDWTLGYAFTPNAELLVTHVRHLFGKVVSIWTDDGELVLRQPVVSTTRFWKETRLITPVRLHAGQRYRIGAYSAGGLYYLSTAGPTNFAHGTFDAEFYSAGDEFPSTTRDVSTWWLVDIRYAAQGITSVPVTPTASASFVNGSWTGLMTVLGGASNLVLLAEDRNGHFGKSAPLDAPLVDDLGVEAYASINPLLLGEVLTYSIRITNSGPSPATGVIVTNRLPGTAAFVSASSTHGSCVHLGGEVVCAIGNLAGGEQAALTIAARPQSTGLLTNVTVISRAETDSFEGNNIASTLTRVVVPALWVNDVAVGEGDDAYTCALFNVRLDPPATTNVWVGFTLSNGTATAGSDFLSRSGVLMFEAGQTNRQVCVIIIGDTAHEVDETFSLLLFSPTNAVLGRSVAIGTILNDDPLPYLSIAGASTIEGTPLILRPTLSRLSYLPVTGRITTSDGTAFSPQDYLGTNVFFTIAPGDIDTMVLISTFTDHQCEPSKYFLIDVPEASGVSQVNVHTQPIILNDESNAPPGLAASGATLFEESYSPRNSIIDAGERVGVSLSLQLVCGRFPSNIVATLLPTGGVLAPSGPETYANIGSYQRLARPFFFTASASNGSLLVATLELREGATFLGTQTYRFPIGPTPDFSIISLSTNQCRAVDASFVHCCGENNGAIGVSSSNLFTSGFRGTGRFLLDDLTNAGLIGSRYPMLAGDLHSETVYAFTDGEQPLGESRGSVRELLEIDSTTGLLTGNRLPVWGVVDTGSASPGLARLGIFSGYDRVVVHVPDGRVFSIRIPWGDVTEIGRLPHGAQIGTENSVYWGIAEHFGGDDYLVYIRDPNTIVRKRIRDGLSTPLARFEDLGQMAAITASLSHGRWYFHGAGPSVFGLESSLAGYCDASFSLEEILRITSLDFSGPDTRLRFGTISGKLYSLERSPNLTAGSWTPITGQILGDGGILERSDAGGAQRGGQFYRIRAAKVGPQP